MKIYTKTGDHGQTALFDGTRVPKSDPRVSTYGDVDELNAWLGFALAFITDADLVEMLRQIQRDLFALGARLADPRHRIAERVSKAAVTGEDVARLEGWIDRLEEELPPLRRFILAGGSQGGAALHVARTVCRRAERAIVALVESNEPSHTKEPGAPADPELLIYVNRLSDLLFVMARAASHRAGAPELEW
ncbi:MAG TPA: cob(I)yrinic acid a,c-diamide adenosyltransferase [Vicinamibacterales bacterium]|nr:cob(I)yrinic acid a,c-diamide adenosyltransferase [Vicinamibacterales bacterium]